MMNCLRAVRAILLPAELRSAAVVFLLMLAGTVLEMVSIGLVVPALAVLTGDSVRTPAVLRRWMDPADGAAAPGPILLMLLALVGIYAVKSAFLFGAAYWTSRTVRKRQANVSRRLFASFLAQPWTFHLERNSSALLQLMNDTQQFSMVCTTLVQIVSELLVLAGLLALLAWMEPLGAAVVAGTLGLAFGVFNVVVRRRVVGWAVVRQHHMQMFVKHVRQALGGAKEVKVRGCEREFLDQFREHTDGVARMGTRQSLAEQMPRLWFELFAVAALFILAAAMVWEGRPTRALVPMLGLFATVAFRVLPGVSYAASAMQRLRQFEPMLTALREHLVPGNPAPDPAPSPACAFRHAIRIEGVTYRYPGGHDAVLRDVDIEIPHGMAVGFVGGSGTGKSTLVDVILGLLPPSSGRVTVDGVDIRDNPRGWQRIIGYVPQSIYLCDDTIRRNVAFGVPDADIDDDAVRRALAAARLDDLVATLPDGVQTVVGERGMRLSGGQRQRIGIARALYHEPEVLVLDEATSALDVATEREVMAAVDALHGAKTLVIVAHRPGTVAGCDVLHRLDAGRVVESVPRGGSVPG